MGGLLHLFYLHQGHNGKKHKKRGGDDGLKATQSRSELPAQTSGSQYDAADSQQDLAKTVSYPADESMKKLINQEISKRSIDRQTAPSVVAKLMGMDLIPSDPYPDSQTDKTKPNETIIPAHKTTPSPYPQSSKKSKSKSKSARDSYFRYWTGGGTNSGRPQPRVHPQEKELQQFKKEFEAWQAARFLECARVVELGNIPDQWLAQLNLTKEKMALYESSRSALIDRSTVNKPTLSKSRSMRESGAHHYLERNDLYSHSSRTSNIDVDRVSDKSSAPTKIVILKPGPDSFTTNDESWVSSTCSVEDRDCIEDLLEEVKERLKYEMQSKMMKKGSMVRGGGIETPYKEKYTKPERKLVRSKSAKTYRSENYLYELNPCSPSKDTRKLLSDRLRNALNNEDQKGISDISHGFSRSPFIDDARERLEKARDILNAEASRNNSWGRSFRYDEKSVQDQTSSPRNLTRSLSAPVSGTSFGKLLLEDRYVSSGAHIKRKHESVDGSSMDVKRSEGFSFKEKVSNMKYSLSLRKKLFSKKLQSSSNEFESGKDIMNGPTVLSSFNYRNENLTEVPPSPASICNSPREDLWKPMDNPSPLSTSEVTSVGDHSVGHAFREISSNLTELRKQLNQLEYEGSEITTVTECPSETEGTDPEDESESYIRTLLITSGLYNSPSEKTFSRWDPHVKPMSNWVFEKVEETYQKPINNKTDEASSINFDDTKLYHKLLFDLVNEALVIVLSPPRTLPKYKGVVTHSANLYCPRVQGKVLLRKVWEMVREYVHPNADTLGCYSLDDLASHDLDVMPWWELINEDAGVVGKELECLITNELLEEVLADMKKG